MNSNVKIKSLFKLTILVIVLLFLCFWLLLLLDEGGDVSLNRRGVVRFSRTLSEHVVDTPGCRIPDFPVFDPKLDAMFSNEPNPAILNCDPTKKGELVKATSSELFINKEAIRRFTNETFSCCYQHFWGKTTSEKPAKDYPVKEENDVQYADMCIPIIERTRVDRQFVRVTCTTAQEAIIYEDYFAFAINHNVAKKAIKDRKRNYSTRGADKDKYSVLILGFDGMSRLNFLRQMPRTADFVESNGGVTLLGFNKVGYNTFPNIVPMLTGMNRNELRESCWPSRSAFLDSCPWIWKSFKAKGYYTAYGEDSHLISTFLYCKRGFRRKPVDYYMKPYFSESETHLMEWAVRRGLSPVCVGNKPNIVRFANAFHGFATNMKNSPSFGLFWSNGLSHDSLTSPRLGDKLFRSMLNSLKDGGALDSTVLIVMSDHGIRWGSFRETFQGYMEERLPFAGIILPEKFKKRFPRFVNKLQENAKRLTTPFDLHETLKDVLFMKTRLNGKSRNLNRYRSRGLSLFYEIPTTRTCRNADIPLEWCSCSTFTPRNPDYPFFAQLGGALVSKINRMLDKYPQCLPLSLQSVRSAWEETPAVQNITESILANNPIYFVVMVEVAPGDAVFEGRIRYEPHHLSVVGTISRLDRLLDRAPCIDHANLKLYCYCRTNYEKDKADDLIPSEQLALMKNAITSPTEFAEEVEDSQHILQLVTPWFSNHSETKASIRNDISQTLSATKGSVLTNKTTNPR